MSTKPVIVIVPGAFHKPSHYAPIITRLGEKGYTVVANRLIVAGDVNVSPEATHRDDVKAIRKSLVPYLDEGREAVMVCHSWGSLPGVEAVEGLSVPERKAGGKVGGIKAVVNVAGLSFPERGKNVMGGDDPWTPMDYHAVKDGLAYCTEGAKGIFYSGVAPEQADAAFADLCKFQSMKSISTWPEYIASDITVPKTYILCEADKAIPPALQERFIEVGRYDEVVRVDTGHAPFLQMPDRVVEIIVDVAEK